MALTVISVAELHALIAERDRLKRGHATTAQVVQIREQCKRLRETNHVLAQDFDRLEKKYHKLKRKRKQLSEENRQHIEKIARLEMASQ